MTNEKFLKVYGHQTWQTGDLWYWTTTNKVTSAFNKVVTLALVTSLKTYSTRPMVNRLDGIVAFDKQLPTTKFDQPRQPNLTELWFLLWQFWGCFKHEIIIWTEITGKIIPYKSLLNLACLWNRAGLTINNKHEFILIQDHQLAENLILLLVFTKAEQRGKSEFVKVNLQKI